MTDLSRSVAASGVDHQITLAESQQLAKAAGGNHDKLSRALEKQGFRSWDADRLASQILAKAKAGSDPTVLAFPAPAPVKADHAVNFAGKLTARLDLLRSAPQAIPSDPSLTFAMSAGAAVMAALILDSQSPKAAKANAQAIAAAAKDLGVDAHFEAAALKRMASGTMTPKDVQELQLLLMAMASSVSTGEFAQPGNTKKELDGLIGTLRGHGALQHSDDLTFSQEMVTATAKSAKLVPQWTVTAGGIHVNTWAHDGDDRSAIVEPLH
jgi:hypothetical protein